MDTDQFIIVVLTIIFLFFGSMYIIFYTRISLLVVPLYWFLVIIPAQYLYKRLGEEQIKKRAPPEKPGGIIFERESEEEEVPKPIEEEGINKTGGKKKINPVLFSAQTLWPFDPFPDNLVIQEKTVSFFRKSIFSTGVLMTFPISSITDSLVYNYPFFAILRINIKGSGQSKNKKKNQLSYNFPLTKEDALQAKELLDGLILIQQKVVFLPKQPSLQAKKKTLESITKSEEIENVIKKGKKR